MVWSLKRHVKMRETTTVIAGENFYDKNKCFASNYVLVSDNGCIHSHGIDMLENYWTSTAYLLVNKPDLWKGDNMHCNLQCADTSAPLSFFYIITLC